jgi:uncharacterized protein (TIGR02118 family)
MDIRTSGARAQLKSVGLYMVFSSCMARLLVLYGTPTDVAGFDRYYRHIHIPLAKKIPGLRSYSINCEPIRALAGNAPHLVAVLDFDSMSDLNAALTSQEGQAAAADLQNFASGGATVLVYEPTAV